MNRCILSLFGLVLWCCMIWVIWNHWSSFASSHWDAPLECGHLTKSAFMTEFFLSQANHHETTVLIISVSWSQWLCVRHSYLCILFSLGILLSRTHLEYKTVWDWPVKMNWHSGRVGCFSRPPSHPSLFSLSLYHFLLSDVGGATNNCYFAVFFICHGKNACRPSMRQGRETVTKQFYPGKHPCGSSCLLTSILCLKCLRDWLS